jgi:hypothetical protein
MPPGAWTPVSCECCLLLSRGLCDRPITRPEEFRDVSECGIETSITERPRPIRAVAPCIIQKPQSTVVIINWGTKYGTLQSFLITWE